MTKSIPLHDILFGHDAYAPKGVANVRVSGRQSGLDELAASIASLGLLQPLLVISRPLGHSYVVDGNRRLAALKRLASAGTIPHDAPIEVVERDASTAREAGLAANLNQLAMHEADQVAAFAELAAEGLKAKDIAARFGVAVAHAKRLLALGSVSPRILDAWREGKLALAQVQTFTLAPTAEEQERVYDKLAKSGRLWANEIRDELGADRSTGRLLKAVGTKAYKAAGGHIVKDLFGESSGVSDRALLTRLSTQMTDAVRDALDTEPRVALAGLLAGATCRNPWSAPIRLRLEGLGHEAARVADNEAFDVLFVRYLSMSDTDLFASLGRVLARGVDLRSRTPGAGSGAGAPADSPAIQGLTEAIDADTLAARLRDRFDAADFFGSAPKAVTLAAIAEACGAEAAARAGKLKKGELVDLAVRTVVPTGWLPKEIRWPGYAGPGAEQTLAEAA